MTARLTVGSSAPEFTLPDADGNEVSLSDFAGSSVIVYFYPAAMTPGCTTQAVDFTNSKESLDEAGYSVLGISPDPVDRLANFTEKSGIAFRLLSDADKEVMNSYGAYGTKKLYGKEVEGVLRSTFIIDVDDDGNGTVREAKYNVKATGHVARLLKELDINVA